MYNALWIHSLPYSKFIELTLIMQIVNTKSVYTFFVVLTAWCYHYRNIKVKAERS